MAAILVNIPEMNGERIENTYKNFEQVSAILPKLVSITLDISRKGGNIDSFQIALRGWDSLGTEDSSV